MICRCSTLFLDWFRSTFLSVSIVCLLVGCDHPNSHLADDQQHEDEHQHEGEHEEEHEHHAAHWPESLSQAVRWLHEIRDLGKPHGEVSPVQELEDILRWLPELVADTDLDEAGFDQIDRLAQSLLQQVKPMRQQGESLERILELPLLHQLCEQLEKSESLLREPDLGSSDRWSESKYRASEP